MRSALLAAIACSLILLSFSACGGDDDNSSSTPTLPAALSTLPPSGPHEQPAPAQPLNGQPVEPVSGVIEITIANTSFVQNYLRVPLGQSVTIRVTNKDPIQHSLRLAGLDGQFDTEDDALTNPTPLGDGASGELTFAPQAAGAYTFRCDFHPTQMGGQIIVGDATPGSAPTAVPSDTGTPAP